MGLTRTNIYLDEKQLDSIWTYMKAAVLDLEQYDFSIDNLTADGSILGTLFYRYWSLSVVAADMKRGNMKRSASYVSYNEEAKGAEGI